jgi:hypothetical protein
MTTAHEVRNDVTRNRMRSAFTGIVLSAGISLGQMQSSTAISGHHVRQTKLVIMPLPESRPTKVGEWHDTPHYEVKSDVTSTVTHQIFGAISAFRDLNGRESDLIDAVDQIEEMGSVAWAALVGVAGLQIPEVEYFLGVMSRISDIDLSTRVKALAKAAKNRSANVRSTLLEIAVDLPREEGMQLTQAVVGSGFDDDVTERACERLQYCYS